VIRGIMANDTFGLFLVVFLSFSLILIKGSYSDGQKNLFSFFIERYTEETSASIISPNHAQLADINSLYFYEGVVNETNIALEAPTLQQNSLLSYNALENDFKSVEGASRSSVTTYTVQPGDALSFIASDYGVSISSIMWANDLRNADSIKPGMDLKIPPVSGVIHIVKDSDTIGSIAEKYGVKTEEVLEFNKLPKDGAIQIGAEIIVPGGIVKQAPSYAGSSSGARFTHLPDLGGYFAIPSTGFNWGKIHGRNGVDIANSCGTPIYAAADGQVTISDSVGWNGGFGKYIKIVHPNGTESIYAHNSQNKVSSGQYIYRGQLIALMGTTGRSTGCHLHFETHGARNPLAKY
jgi:murein DD-endopeptidase MepM/ murein hydrolase activator NlpD